MSRSRRGQRNLGDEYWSRRPLNGYGPSSENKHITHGIERARARQEIMKELVEDFHYSKDGDAFVVGVRFDVGPRLPDRQESMEETEEATAGVLRQELEVLGVVGYYCPDKTLCLIAVAFMEDSDITTLPKSVQLVQTLMLHGY